MTRIPDQYFAFCDAKFLIGRRLVLRRALRDYPAGTPCVVMCVVDFGDGPLVWVATDDVRVEDVDQFSVEELTQVFQLTGGVNASGTIARPVESFARNSARPSQPVVLKS